MDSTIGDKRTWLACSKAKHLKSTECQNNVSKLISAATSYLLIPELRAHLIFSKVALLELDYMSSYLTFILSPFFIIHTSNSTVKIEYLISSQAL